MVYWLALSEQFGLIFHGVTPFHLEERIDTGCTSRRCDFVTQQEQKASTPAILYVSCMCVVLLER